MTIHLKPELEALIQKDTEGGPYQSADEFVEHGYAQAERGELIEPAEVRARLNERKQAWIAER
jgi:Arc/MetJ-type ribon-helix-helix transcriptional regulator